MFKTPEIFAKNFVFTDEDWKQFVQQAAKDSIDLSKAGSKEKDDLVISIKSSIARQLWRTEGFFEMMNTTDPAVKKAMELLKK